MKQNTATPAMLPLDDETWVLRCADVAQRKEMLDYAASKNVPLYRHNSKFDSHLSIGWYKDLMTYGDNEDAAKEGEVTVEQFKAMCDAYAA